MNLGQIQSSADADREADDSEPDDFYKTLIAKIFGTITAAFSPDRLTAMRM